MVVDSLPPANDTDCRLLAYQVLRRVAAGGYADLTLDAALRRSALASRDRALATELVYGSLRRRASLDYALAPCCRQPLATLEPAVLDLLRLGAYQLLFLDRVPAHAAIHSSVELTRQLRLQRAAGLVNAVLRALQRRQPQLRWPTAEEDPLGWLTATLSLPDWLAQRWWNQYGLQPAGRLAACLLLPAPLTLRVNRLQTTPAQLLAQLAEAGYAAEACRYAVDGIRLLQPVTDLTALPGFASGAFQPQDEASQLIAPLLQPQAGQRLLDVCAAPGGKTCHLAALTHNQADILAVDLHAHRLRKLEQGARRLGCQRVQTLCLDMRLSDACLPDAAFDGVLVDAPCSGLGVLRRNAELRWRRQPDDIADLAQLQQQILQQAARRVAPGGRLLYSLCTTTPEESDAQVAEFLRRQPDFELEPLQDRLPPELLDAQGCLRTCPSVHDGMDGFFAACLRRR
ncbi:16S rRNA (cytosine(967)-C(5))-methyltransferase RsmB [Desulfuromonas thiophila]|uniref:16S rRNA (cytosine(967)-C(5))-methyltransferase n=1 Tax=Desulfuromonas thiophila TaxID=57664 RepID=A0A1G7A348_9BACT|nr:16S rRNA (cytosine(967)-C(5))-methyltransferase RsmB [Desulfuromonas thiophila]SDE08326.1 16S rRNA (cytosine967-C5)-methyltransferase [Desulfuromonas thiophila]